MSDDTAEARVAAAREAQDQIRDAVAGVLAPVIFVQRDGRSNAWALWHVGIVGGRKPGVFDLWIPDEIEDAIRAEERERVKAALDYPIAASSGWIAEEYLREIVSEAIGEEYTPRSVDAATGIQERWRDHERKDIEERARYAALLEAAEDLLSRLVGIGYDSASNETLYRVASDHVAPLRAALRALNEGDGPGV